MHIYTHKLTNRQILVCERRCTSIIFMLCCFSLSDTQGGEGEGTGGHLSMHASPSRPVSVPEKPQNESACAAVPRCGSGETFLKGARLKISKAFFQSLSVRKSVDKSMIRRLRHRWDHVAGSGGIPGTAPAGFPSHRLRKSFSQRGTTAVRLALTFKSMLPTHAKAIMRLFLPEASVHSPPE